MINCWKKPLRGAEDPLQFLLSPGEGWLLLCQGHFCQITLPSVQVQPPIVGVQRPSGDNLITSATLNTCDMLLEKVLLLCGF